MENLEEKEVKNIFDPTKRYQWEQDDIIEFTGFEFDIMNKAISAFVMGDATNVQNIIKVMEVFAIMQNKFAENVNNGLFKEFIPIETNTAMRPAKKKNK